MRDMYNPGPFAGEIARFKVYPNGRCAHWFWTVIVFKHKGLMRKAFHVLNGTEDRDDRFGAIVMPQERQVLLKGKWRRDPSLGYVLFAKTQLGTETQAHEAVHMATSYLRRIKKWPQLGLEIDDREEDLAYHIGYCAGQLHEALYKNRCYEA